MASAAAVGRWASTAAHKQSMALGFEASNPSPAGKGVGSGEELQCFTKQQSWGSFFNEQGEFELVYSAVEALNMV